MAIVRVQSSAGPSTGSRIQHNAFTGAHVGEMSVGKICVIVKLSRLLRWDDRYETRLSHGRELPIEQPYWEHFSYDYRSVVGRTLVYFSVGP